MILLWGIILFAALELWGCSYVNWVQPWLASNENVVASIPSIQKAEYEIYITANRRTLYSNNVIDTGGIVTMTGYYYLDGNKYRYNKMPLIMDEKYFGTISVTKRQE
jgi:hypothetical protein